MDAVADYAAAKAMLEHPLPAYVSYTSRSHVKFDAIQHDDTTQVVVRTKDGKILKGDASSGEPTVDQYVKIGGRASGADAVVNPAFAPSCYEADAARITTFEGKTAEAIALRDECASAQDDKNFDTLYVDPATHRPLAAAGAENDEHVTVELVQRFGAVGGYVLPSSLYVRVRGHGMMGWLDVLYDGHYGDFSFSATEP